MSALGHKQTYAAYNGMSALPPIATMKADIRNKSCLLYPQERTCAAHYPMSALGLKRTHAPQQKGSLFDHLVGAIKHGERTSRPSALAVFTLITSSNLVGCSTGRSAGFTPLRIRST